MSGADRRPPAFVVRAANERDLPGLVAIYNAVIATTTATYTTIAATIDERRNWMAQRQAKGCPVLVAVTSAGTVLGFSSFGEFRSWPGYRHSVEHTVHVDEAARGLGVGTALVEALFAPALALGKHVMIGAVDAGNEASLRFHARLGFSEVGRLPEVGRKFGRWLDLVLVQKILDAPGAPRAD